MDGDEPLRLKIVDVPEPVQCLQEPIPLHEPNPVLWQ
jgi:hypothetical protein